MARTTQVRSQLLCFSNALPPHRPRRDRQVGSPSVPGQNRTWRSAGRDKSRLYEPSGSRTLKTAAAEPACPPPAICFVAAAAAAVAAEAPLDPAVALLVPLPPGADFVFVAVPPVAAGAAAPAALVAFALPCLGFCCCFLPFAGFRGAVLVHPPLLLAPPSWRAGAERKLQPVMSMCRTWPAFTHIHGIVVKLSLCAIGIHARSHSPPWCGHVYKPKQPAPRLLSSPHTAPEDRAERTDSCSSLSGTCTSLTHLDAPLSAASALPAPPRDCPASDPRP